VVLSRRGTRLCEKVLEIPSLRRRSTFCEFPFSNPSIFQSLLVAFTSPRLTHPFFLASAITSAITTIPRAEQTCELLGHRRRISALTISRESFESIYLDLSKNSGKCRLAESGLGWKPGAGGETFTLDASQIASAQWSRASKGYEIKILTRNVGVLQLDGFEQEVRMEPQTVLHQRWANDDRISNEPANASRSGTEST
jgi:POB3-like N-terminal PH domain